MFLGIMLVFSDAILFLVFSFAEVNNLVSINSELTKHSGDFFRFFFFSFCLTDYVLMKLQHCYSDSKPVHLYSS